MKSNHKLPVGQVVVFETANKKFKVGTIVEVKPTHKRVEYTVYGEDGKVVEGLTNSVEGSFRIDLNLTKQYCKKYNLEVTEASAEYARYIRETKVVPDAPDTDANVVFADAVSENPYNNSHSESED